MPVAVIQDWVEEETERSTRNYDELSRRLAASSSGPPEGLHVHAAGFTGHGFRIFEVWDTVGHFERFRDERLMPLVTDLEGDDARPPELTVYELHNLMTV